MRKKIVRLVLTSFFSIGFTMFAAMQNMSAAAEGYSKFYVGTYTGDGPNDSRGIYVVDFDSETGKCGEPRLAGETTNPSFLTVDAAGKRLYSVAETRSSAGRSGASVIGWNVQTDGSLQEIGRAATSGDGPCFVSLSHDETLAGVANYGGGSVALFTVNSDGAPQLADAVQHNGSSANPQRQGEPHAHAFQFSPDGKRAYASDLGTDELVVYDITADKKLVRNDKLTFKLTPGHGPRHFAFSADNRFVLVIEELGSMLTVLAIGNDGMKMVDEVSTLPANFSGVNSTAEVQFHPNGKFVYGSNRGHDSLAIFAFDAKTGKLASVGHVKTGGETPRNFRFSPDGRWLIAANQSTDNLVVFKVGDDGVPVPTGEEARVSKPVCVKFAK